MSFWLFSVSATLPESFLVSGSTSMRYSLRTLFVAFTVMAVVPGYFFGEARRQARLVESLEADGCYVTFGTERPAWLPAKLDIGLTGRVQRLSISRQVSIDSSLLANFPNVKMLSLDGSLRDLTGLSKLDLVILYLEPDGELDLDEIAQLSNLSELIINNFSQSDISPLQKLKQLQSLSLGCLYVTDLSALSELRNLEEIAIFANSNQELDVSALRGLKKLRMVELGNVSDISALGELKRLYYVDVENAPLENASKLSGAENIKFLYLAGTQIEDISFVTSLKKLEYLDLAHTKVKDVSPVAGCASLKVLNLPDRTLPIGDVERIRQQLPECEICYP
jgi:hypothetical protein